MQPILALEKRIAFDGAAVALAAKVAHTVHTAAETGHTQGSPLLAAARDSARTEFVTKTTTATRIEPLSSTSSLVQAKNGLFAARGSSEARNPTSVVFIESNVADVAALIKDISPSATIVMLDATKDGVDAIASYLAAHKGVENVYIFSHGSDAQLSLGTANLNAGSMQGRYAADLATIKASLGANANLLIYGCDFAEFADGDSAAHLLSQLTGASVAASTNLTGGTAEGGDFVLEDQIGSITAPNILSATIASDYDGLMASPTTLFANAGTGLYHSNIEFLTYANTSLASGGITNGATATYTTSDGSTITETFSNVSNASDGATYKPAAFSAYSPSKLYSGYNNTSSTSEMLYGGGYSGTVSFTITFTATNAAGKSYAPNLVFADSELTDASGESYTVTTNGGGFQNVETVGSTGYTLTGVGTQSFSLKGTTAGVPLLVTTGATTLNVSIQTSGGKEGFAIGLVEPTLTLDANNSSGSTGSNYITTFTEKGSAVSIGDTDTTATEPGGSASSAKIVLTNAQASDVLSVGTLPSGITSSVDTSVSGQVTVTLSGAASLASYQSAIQAVRFSNTSSNPSTVDRTVDVTYNDGSLNSNTAVTTINVAAVNNAPVETTPGVQTTNKDTALSISGLSVSDVDANGGAETVTLSVADGTISLASTSGLTFSTGTGSNDTSETFTGTLGAINNAIASVKYQPNTGYSGSDSLSFATNDNGNTGSGGAMTTTQNVAINVNNVNPTRAGSIGNQSDQDGQSGISIATSQAFSDGLGLPLTYSATGLPAGLSINPTTGQITGTIDHDASKNSGSTTGSGATLVGTYSIIETASDGQGGSTTQTFTIKSSNQAPTLGTNTGNQTNYDGDTITAVDASKAFSDPNDDPLTFSATGLPSGLSISSAGLITGTVTKTATVGTDDVIVTATDDKGAATTETFSWLIKNLPPATSGTLANKSYSDGQSGIAIATASGFTDANGNRLTYSASGLPTGLSINASTGQITGTLDHDASKTAGSTTGSGATLVGTYHVVVTASDGFGGSATQGFAISSSNQAPITGTATADQTNKDGQTITPVATGSTFSDPNGDPLTFSVSNLPAGLSINATTGLISGTVANTATPETYLVRVTATDDKGAAARETFNWTIQNVPPTANGTLSNQTYADSAANISIATAGGFTNSNGLALTYSATGLPSGLSINPTSGQITGQLDHDASENAPTTRGSGATLDGTYMITVTVSDGQGGTATQTFTIDAKNTAPTIVAATPAQTGADGEAASINTSTAFVDSNTGDTLTYAVSGLPTGVSVDVATGVISGTIDPRASNGSPYNVSVTATDDKGAGTTESFQWTIENVAPTATPGLPDRSAYDGSAVSYATSGGFTNPNGLPLDYSATGLPTGVTIDPSTGIISGTLNHDASIQSANGTYTIAVTANDGQGGTATNTFHLVASNQAPVIGTSTANQASVDGGTIATLDASQAFSDPNGDPLTFAASNLPTGLSIDATGKITGTVGTTTKPQTYAVAVTATDDKGLATTETFAWQISDAAPLANGSIASQTYADSTAGISIATAGAFTSPNNLPLTYSATGLPSGVSIDATTGRITGQIDHDASKNAPTTSGSGATLDGTYRIVVTAADGQGGTATQTFTIDATNTAPALVAQTANQSSYDGNTAAVDAAAAFRDANTGDAQTYVATGLPKGLVIDPTTGMISGTIDKSASTTGSYSVTVTVTDDKGAATRETFSWTVGDVAPVATPSLPDQAAADSSTVSYQTASGFTNPNNLPLAYSATGLPTGLTIDGVSGVISGTLNHDASNQATNGTYTIAVTVDDGQGGTATTTFHLVASNQAPVLGTKTADQSTSDGQAITAIDVSQAFADPNAGDVVTYGAANLPRGLSIDPASGHITGTVAGNAAPGTYAVIVTATDDKGAATTEVFSWTIIDVAPGVGSPLPGETLHDSASNVALATASGFTSPNGLALTYSANGLPAGLIIDPKTGQITGTLDHDASVNGISGSGVYQVVVTASDGQGGTAQQTFAITTVNDAPQITAQTANQESTATNPGSLNVGVAFTDPNLGDGLTFTATNLPTGLSLDPKTGLVSGTIANSAAGSTFAVTIIATDDKGAATTESFNWTIDALPPSNVAPIPNLSTFDGSAVSIDTSGNFGGSSLFYTVTGLPAGLSINAATGLISGTIDHDASQNATLKQTGSGATLDGIYSVTVTVTNLNGFTSQTFVIDSANEAPVVNQVTANQSTPAGQTVATVNASQAFADPNGDTLTYSASELPPGLAINTTTGLITGTISETASPGVYPVVVVATDDKGAMAAETFSWTVTDVAPVANGTIAGQSFADSTSGISIGTATAFSSPNGLPLNFSATGLPAGLSIDPATGAITGQLDHDASYNAPTKAVINGNLDGTYTVTVRASDGQGGTATQTFTIDATDNAPVVGTTTANQSSQDGNAASINASAAFHDPNAGDVLIYSTSNLPSGLDIDPNTGVISGTIAKNASVNGPYSVQVTATDDKGEATTERFTWTVANVAPVATPPLADQGVHDGDTVSYTTVNGFTNPNGLTLTYSATGLPTGLAINTATGVISGAIDRNASIESADGTYAVAVTVNDGQGGIATNSFLIVSTNLAPVVGSKTADETSSDGQIITSVDAAKAFIDPNGDPMTFSVSNLPAGLSIDPTSGLISGAVAGGATPGTYIVTVTATDSKGAPTLETFAWTINDLAPTKSGTIANQTFADGTSNVSLATAQTFVSPNSLPLVFTATGLPTGLSIDPATGLISGHVDHDASANAPASGGVYNVVVSAADGLGGVATQAFAIEATNQAPAIGTATANQHSYDGNVASIDVSSAFADPNTGDIVTYRATGLPQGLSIDTATGLITGTIDKSASRVGTYNVAVTATDDKGAATTETFTWVIDNVAPVATPPLADRSVPDGTLVSYPTVGGFTNPNTLAFTYRATGLPKGLTIDASTGVISGTLDHDASAAAPGGIYAIAVTVDDGQGGTATAKFDFVATNQAATVGTVTADQLTKAGYSATPVDASKAFTDPNGDPLTFTASNLPAGLSIDASTGLISGTVAANASPGLYAVRVTATDDKGAASLETFEWAVNDVPPVVQAVLANETLADSTSGVSIATAAGFKSPINLLLTYSAAGLPSGLSIDPATGIISGFIRHDASKDAPVTSGSGGTLDGTYTIAVTVSDGAGGTATQSFTIDATNQAPTLGTATADQHLVDGGSVALNASVPFADPNIGDIVTFTATGLPKGLAINPSTGLISGTIDPHASTTSPYVVSVTATDDKGAATTETFTINVADAPPTVTTPVPPVSAAAGTAISPIDSASHFASPSGLALTYSATGLPAGLTIDPATGLISGTLDHDASANAPVTTGAGATLDGTYTVVVTASDGQGGIVSQSVTIDAKNEAPVVAANTADQSSVEGQTIAPLETSPAFRDPNGDPLVFTATGLPPGIALDPGTGEVTGTIAHDAKPGVYQVTVTASDDKGAIASEIFAWTVADTGPYATTALSPVVAADGLAIPSIDTADGFASPNGASLTYSATGLPKGLSIDAATGVISGQVDHEASLDAPITAGAGATLDGTYVVVVSVDDGQGGTASQSFTLDVQNKAPQVVAPTGDQSATDGGRVTPVDTSGAFRDPNGDPLTFAATGLPPGLAVDPATGAITGTIARDATPGAYSVTVTATDDKGASGSETFVWTVGRVPPTVASPTPDQSNAAGATIGPVHASDAFSDANGAALTYSATGLPPGLSIEPQTGLVSGTIATGTNLAVSYTVVVTATDPNGDAASEAFAWHIDQVAPSILATSGLPRAVLAAELPALPPAIDTRDPALSADLQVRGAVLEAVHQISGDPEISSFSVTTDGIVIATVNNIRPLDGLQSIDGRADIVRNAAAADVRGDRFSRVFDGTGDDPEAQVETIDVIGDALRYSSLITDDDGATINVETLIRDRTLLIRVDNRSAIACVVPVARYSVTGADGAPLPSWLDGDARGVLTGKIPGGVEAVDLLIHATLTNGVTLDRRVTIETTNGSIRPMAPAGAPRAGLSLPKIMVAAREQPAVRHGPTRLPE